MASQRNASFLDKYSPTFQLLFFKNLAFSTQIMKMYAIVEISINIIICETESISTWI